MSTRKGEASRERIIAAAWDAVDDTGVEQLLAGVSLRQVAERAGVSPSAVTYHFETMPVLADAMARWLLARLSLDPVDAVEAALALPGPIVADTIRAAADLNWGLLTTPDEQRYERRLMRLFAATGSPVDGERLARLLAEGYWGAFIPNLERIYEATLDRFGLRLVDPLTPRSMARLGAAASESLCHQWMVDADDVGMSLHSDALVALVSALTVPATHRGEIAELEAGLRAGPDQVPASPDQVADIDEQRRIAALAAPLFVDRFDEVTLTDVARAVDLPVREVADRFGTVRRVAAVSFHRHVDGIGDAARHRVGVEPVLGVLDLLCELTRRVQSDRQCARALLAERIGVQLDATQVVDVDDIRILVPLGPVLYEVARPVTDLTPAALDDVLALVIDTALDYAMTRPDAAPAAVAELVLRLLPRT